MNLQLNVSHEPYMPLLNQKPCICLAQISGSVAPTCLEHEHSRRAWETTLRPGSQYVQGICTEFRIWYLQDAGQLSLGNTEA